MNTKQAITLVGLLIVLLAPITQAATITGLPSHPISSDDQKIKELDDKINHHTTQIAKYNKAKQDKGTSIESWQAKKYDKKIAHHTKQKEDAVKEKDKLKNPNKYNYVTSVWFGGNCLANQAARGTIKHPQYSPQKFCVDKSLTGPAVKEILFKSNTENCPNGYTQTEGIVVFVSVTNGNPTFNKLCSLTTEQKGEKVFKDLQMTNSQNCPGKKQKIIEITVPQTRTICAEFMTKE